LLIVASTLINSLGVRLLAKVNNAGVFAEMAGAVLLVGLLFARARRGPAVILDTQGHGGGAAFGYLGALMAAALTPSYVMYGFDSAGSLAEETDDPRRRAPRAIIGSLLAVGAVGALLILGALGAAPNLADPALGDRNGGFAYLVETVLGTRAGLGLLCVIALAVTVCTLTVHAAAVRLMFSMARDNNLPCSEALARLPESSRAPVVPAVLLGAIALAILLVNINYPQVIEVMAAVAIAWAHLAYLFVTVPLLLRRQSEASSSDCASAKTGLFTLGRWGRAVNTLAVIWGVVVVVNVGWPRAEVYGEAWYRRFSTPLATAAMLAAGGIYYALVQRQLSGVLESHRAADYLPDLGDRIIQGETG
jgi:amino acid transporter